MSQNDILNYLQGIDGHLQNHNFINAAMAQGNQHMGRAATARGNLHEDNAKSWSRTYSSARTDRKGQRPIVGMQAATVRVVGGHVRSCHENATSEIILRESKITFGRQR